MNIDTSKKTLDGLFERPMKEIEAKIIILLCKQNSKWLLPQTSHNCTGIAGFLDIKPQNISEILAAMVARKWVRGKREENGRRIFYTIRSEKTVKLAMKTLGIKPKLQSVLCSVCGTSYGAVLNRCPICVRNEADVILCATAPAVPKEKGLIGLNQSLEKKKELPSGVRKIAGLMGNVARLKESASDVHNAIARENRRKEDKAYSEFVEWCNQAKLTKKEVFCVQNIMTCSARALINQDVWKVRAELIAKNHGTETQKFFRSKVKWNFMAAELYDICMDLSESYCSRS